MSFARRPLTRPRPTDVQAGWPRRCYAAVLLAGPVLALLFVLLDGASSHSFGRTAWTVVGAAWLIAFLVAPILGLRDAIIKYRGANPDGLRRGAITVKLSGIAFFVLNFVAVAGFALLIQLLAAMWAGGGVLALLNIAGVSAIVVITYLIMLPTSAYGLAALLWLRRQQVISKQFFTINLVMHFIFVVDIISSLVVAAKVNQTLRRRPG